MEHNIAKTITALRKAKGWTQVELAAKLNVSDKTISKWESGAGYPEITIFPKLAEIFEVSIDYLMTGKEPEKEFIIMSSAELCAKTDDPSMLDKINPQFKDEKGKTLIDYVIQYESLKVYVALKEKKNFYINMPAVSEVRLALLANRPELLDNLHFGTNQYGLLAMLPKDEEVHQNSIGKKLCILTDDIFQLICCDNRITRSTLDYIMGKQKNRDCVWYHIIPYLIHTCYINKKKALLDELIKLAITNNQFAYDTIKFTHDDYYNSGNSYSTGYFFIATNKGYGIVRILEQTLKLALDKSDFEYIEKFNSINKEIKKHYTMFTPFIANDDDLRIAHLKADKSITPDELLVQSAIKDGILNIAKVLETKRLALVKSALQKYPVSKAEILNNAYKKIASDVEGDDWRFIFEYAVDNNSHDLAQYVANSERDAIIQWVEDKNKIERSYSIDTVLQLLSFQERNNPNLPLLKLRDKSKDRNIQTVEAVAEYISLCKEQIISDLENEIKQNDVAAELTEDYFNRELARGNRELVIIKLCVLLEAILKGKYRYEGDFSDMLEKYCKEHGFYDEDDGWGYIETKTYNFVSPLQKLRKCRNNIVHSEKSGNATLSDEELKFCINYICNMN